MAWKPVVLVAALLLAGCAGGGKSEVVDLGGSQVDLKDVQSQAGKGSIAGIVVDEAIRPVVGASIQVAASDLTATSDERGVFTFTDLEPGVYILSAQAEGFLAIQTSADVAADQATVVRVLLVRDDSPVPYRTTYQHEGFMQAWAGIGQYYVEASLDEGSALCDCRLYFTPEPGLGEAIYEAFWEYTTPDPADLAEMYYVVEQIDGEAYVADYCYSPCYDAIKGAEFTPGVEAYARLDGPDLYPAYQQSFKLFMTLWYNGEAPEGWTIANET